MTKLLTQGDDFGFTRAVTDGIVDCIDRGILRNTGLFANMPATEYAVSFMKDRPQACFGIDFNIVAGKPVCDPKDVPHLVDENGYFIKSGVSMRKPEYASEEGRRALFPYEEVYKELRAQYDRYVELVGHKPGYLHPHSIMPETYLEAIRAISLETGVVYSMDLHQKLGVYFPMFKSNATKNKVFDAAEQLKKDTLGMTLEIKDELLNHDLVMLGGHPGYIDAELLELTSLSLERCKDAQMLMSQEVKAWVEENNVELVTYYDLVK